MTPQQQDLHEVLEKLGDVNERLIRLEERTGRIHLTPQALMLVWVIAVAVVGAAAAAAVTTFQVSSLAKDFKTHVEKPHHQGTQYKLDEHGRRLDDVERTVRRERERGGTP